MSRERISDGVAKLTDDDLPEALFGFTPWSHMIPPEKPEDALILSGQAWRIDALIRKIWGSRLSIVWGVASDTFAFKFDFVCVDLWEGNQPSGIIFRREFALYLMGVCKKYLCVNVPRQDMIHLQRNLRDNGQFHFQRGDLVGENVVLFWSADAD